MAHPDGSETLAEVWARVGRMELPSSFDWFVAESGADPTLIDESWGRREVWPDPPDALLLGLTFGARDLAPHPLAAANDDPRWEVLGHLWDPEPAHPLGPRLEFLLGAQVARAGLRLGDLPALLRGGGWDMSRAEKALVLLLASALRPQVAIETGTFTGGSARALAACCDRVITIDRDPAAAAAVADLANVEFRCGEAADQLALALAAHPEASLVLLDADHTAAGVRREVEQVLAARPDPVRGVFIHDSGNPTCRAGLLEVDWSACPWLESVSLGFVPPTWVKNGLWGGAALVWLAARSSNAPVVDLAESTPELPLDARSTPRSEGRRFRRRPRSAPPQA